MNAKFARTLLAVLSISALILAGCSSDSANSNPTGPTDNSTTGTTGGGAGTINASNVGAVQAALTTTFTNVFFTDLPKGPGTYNGTKTGTVKISGGLPKYTLEFDRYSDDGQLFTTGNITFSPTGPTTFKYTGDITLSGTYSGEIKIDVTVTNGVISGTYTVGGVEFKAG